LNGKVLHNYTKLKSLSVLVEEGKIAFVSHAWQSESASLIENVRMLQTCRYTAALYIPKVVVVAIDIGYTMGQPITSGADKSQTLLATSQNLTRELVKTLSAGPSAADYINIVVFNASNAILLESNPVSSLSSCIL